MKRDGLVCVPKYNSSVRSERCKSVGLPKSDEVLFIIVCAGRGQGSFEMHQKRISIVLTEISIGGDYVNATSAAQDR